jgi:hypothetical protein
MVHKLDWLERVLCDPAMPRLALAVAGLLAVRYFNAEKGYAWMGQATLARRLQANPRSVQRAIARLLAAGWVKCTVSKGRGNANEYRPAIDGISAALIGGENTASTTRKHGVDAVLKPSKTRRRRRPIVEKAIQQGAQEGRRAHARATPPHRPLEAAPLEEASENQSAGRNNRAAHQSAGSVRATPFPEGWELSAAQLSVAQSIAGWEHDRAGREFIKFRGHHEEEESKRRQWPVAWEKWCCDGAKFDEQDGGRRSTTKKGGRIVTEDDLIDQADDLEKYLLRNNRKQS